MTVPTCEYTGCETPLTGRQERFCTLRCYYDAVRIKPRVCPGCRTSYAPLWTRQVYCSPPCVPPPSPPRRPPYTARLILDLLRRNQHSWLTISDLAIWTYGDDLPDDRHAVRCVLYQLRHSHRLETRAATWERVSMGHPLAYRLAQTPVAQEVAA